DTTRRQAEIRALTWLLGTASQAASRLDPTGAVDSQQFAAPAQDPEDTWSTEDAVRWLDTERAAIYDAVGRAGALDLATLVCALLPALPWFYDLRYLWDDQRRLGE